MKLNFWGAAGTVTGSMHLVETGEHRLLLDCGLFQGRRKKAFERNRDIPFDAGLVDAVILSHAHIDHSGNLPSLVRKGFDGPIYCTSATRDLAARMLLDSAHIQESDVAYVNRRRKREKRRLFEPLYTRKDAMATIRQLVPIEYATQFAPLPDVQAAFWDAGHMLGSASVGIDVDEGNGTRRLVFSGDIGHAGAPILRDPHVVPEADYVIMESTYGDRVHAPRSEVRQLLLDAAQRTAEQHGKLIIPAFSVGRTQEIIYHLNALWEADLLPALPIYVDSPLAIDATDIFRTHPECYDEELMELLAQDDDPFGFRHLRYVHSADESRKLNSSKRSAIIISASGMCEAGRILHHLKHHIDDPGTTVLFAGYQAPHTLGRKILEGAKEIPILGTNVKCRAQVGRIEGCSSHADRDELLRWATATKDAGRVSKIFLVHGESDPATALAAGLNERQLAQVEIPQRGDAFEL